MTAAIVVALVALVSGFAHYDYEHTKGDETCRLEIISMRIMGAGQIEIDKDCQIKAGAADMERSE